MFKKINLLIISLFSILSAYADGLDDITQVTTELTSDVYSFSSAVKFLGLALLILGIFSWVLFPKMRHFFADNWKTVGIIFVMWIVLSYYGDEIRVAINGAFDLQKVVRK